MVFAGGCRDQGIRLNYIQPGKPNQNAYLESFERTFRYEVLDAYVFESLHQVREITRRWIAPTTAWGEYHQPCLDDKSKQPETQL